MEFVDNIPTSDPSDEGGPQTDGTPEVTLGDRDEGPASGKDPLRFNNWMKRSATGAVMTGIAAGLREALEPRRQEAPFVIVAPGEPDGPDGPIDLRFDPDSPADTVAIIRRPVSEEGRDAPSSSS